MQVFEFENNRSTCGKIFESAPENRGLPVKIEKSVSEWWFLSEAGRKKRPKVRFHAHFIFQGRNTPPPAAVNDYQLPSLEFNVPKCLKNFEKYP